MSDSGTTTLADTSVSAVDECGGAARNRFARLFGHLGGHARLKPIAAAFLGGDERALARRNAVSAFLIRVVSAGLLYLTQIALARWMGTFEYGIYVFVWTWVLVIGGLAPLGLNTIAIRLVPEYRETGRFALLRGLADGTRGIAFAVGTAIAGLGAAGVYFLGDIVTSYYVLPLYLALICVPLYAVTEVQDGLGRGHAWMTTALLPPYVLRPLMILTVMVAAHEIGFELTAVTATMAAIFATWSVAAIQFIVLNLRMGRDLAEREAREGSALGHAGEASAAHAGRAYDFATWLRLSGPLIVITLCELVLQNADVIIISSYLSPEEVGIYFAAAKTMSLILFVHYAVGSAVANRFAALKARGDEDELKASIADAVAWTFWPSLAAAAVILALGQPLLMLFGSQFLDGYPVMAILVVGFLFRSAMGPAEFLLNMLGEQKRCAAVLAFTALLNIVLNLLLVPYFGLVGAASATSISLSTAALLHYAVVRARLGYEIAIWRNLKRTSRG